MAYPRTGTGYLTSPGGHASISDDGSGNVVIADDKQILTKHSSLPVLAHKDNTDTGLLMTAAGAIVSLHKDGNNEFYVDGSQSRHRNPAKGPGYIPLGATQSITSAATTILTNLQVRQVDLDAPYSITNTPSLQTGTEDGEIIFIENISANTLTLQDETSLANTDIRGIAGANVVIAQNQWVALIWSEGRAQWNQLFAVAAV